MPLFVNLAFCLCVFPENIDRWSTTASQWKDNFFRLNIGVNLPTEWDQSTNVSVSPSPLEYFLTVPSPLSLASSKMAASLCNIPIQWHPTNTPREGSAWDIIYNKLIQKTAVFERRCWWFTRCIYLQTPLFQTILENLSAHDKEKKIWRLRNKELPHLGITWRN